MIGTCRLLFRGQVARLGRLAVERDAARRRRGGRDPARGRPPRAREAGAESIALHAQTYAQALYVRAGLRGARPDLRRGGHRARGHGEAACLSCASTRSPGLRVIVAGERGSRPGAFLDVAPREPIDPESDPFAAGHEDRTPPEVYALRDDGGWRVRVVPNLYPALSATRRRRPAATRSRAAAASPTCSRAGPPRGAHEVVVNAPDPVSSLAELRPEQVETAMSVWRERMRAHADAAYVHVIVERGQGGGRLAAAHARAAVRAPVRARPRWRASASASPPTPTAPRAATCSRTSSRRRCAAASGSWRSTTRRWRSRPSRRACPSTCSSRRGARSRASPTTARWAGGSCTRC